jgi:hypothetical protein
MRARLEVLMKFTIHANNVEWQREYLPRFTDGLTAHGHRVTHTQTDVADVDAVNIIFANNSWRLTHQQCINKNIPLITVGRCFFGSRFDMVAIGWDGFNGAADFCLEDAMPSDRWEKHGDDLTQRIGNPNGYVLVCGEFRPMDQWYSTLREILAGEDVRFRSHPFIRNSVSGWQAAPHAGQDDLASLFPDVRVVITYDSIAGCDAVLAGVPTVAWADTSMARDVSFHSWSAFRKCEDLAQIEGRFDVESWAHRLAYCQWSHDEITSGEFWEHLQHGASKRT